MDSGRKIDMDLLKLLEEMSSKLDIEAYRGSETLSWKAYRKAEQLDDLEIADGLFDYVDAKADNAYIKEAYQALAYILKNSKVVSIANKCLKRVRKLDSNEKALYVVLMGIYEANVPLKEFLEEVVYYIDDERPLIRNAAIRCLGLYSEKSMDAENALLDILEYPYDDYGVRYIAESLGKVGSSKSLTPLHEKIYNLNSNDAINSVNAAIKAISLRSTGNDEK